MARSSRIGAVTTWYPSAGAEAVHPCLDTQDDDLATAGVARVEETLMRLRRGWATMPADAEPGSSSSPGANDHQACCGTPAIHNTSPAAPDVSGGCSTSTSRHLPAGKKESNTLLTERIHRNHLTADPRGRHAGRASTLPRPRVRGTPLKGEMARAGPISSDTIRKELKTLRYVWDGARARARLRPRVPGN